MKKVLISLSIVVFVLSIITIVHIYLVTAADAKPLPNANFQLGRIDFETPLTEEQKKIVFSGASKVKSIKRVVVSGDGKNLIYGFNSTDVTPTNVRTDLLANVGVPAKAFIPEEKTVSNGCPAGMEKQSAFKEFGMWMHRLLD